MVALRLCGRYPIIMRPERYRSTVLADLFRTQTIATLPELKAALGTPSEVTVFRKLAELVYRASYSHRGRYYTLDELAEYDAHGLWCYRSVCFSQTGTLISTLEKLVSEAEAGYFVSELESLVRVEAKGALLKLVQQQRIAREKVTGRYLYGSIDPHRRRQQVVARRLLAAQPTLGQGLVHEEVLPDELKAAIILFYSMLDEQQRRLFAGLESLKLGHGGDQRIADLLDVQPATVARGRRQLLDRDVETERTRKEGAGRKSVEKKRPK